MHIYVHIHICIYIYIYVYKSSFAHEAEKKRLLTRCYRLCKSTNRELAGKLFIISGKATETPVV